MIQRTIKIIKPLKKGTPLPSPVFVELADTELQLDRVSAVKRWISERRENAGVENASSRSNILAWQTKHRLIGKGKLTATPIVPRTTRSKG